MSVLKEEPQVYCICRTTDTEDSGVMLACDRCEDWYHAACCNIKEDHTDLVDEFFCPECSSSKLGKVASWKRRCQNPNEGDEQDCLRPALPYSKYCTESCGLQAARSRVTAWAQKTHKGDPSVPAKGTVDRQRLQDSCRGSTRVTGIRLGPTEGFDMTKLGHRRPLGNGTAAPQNSTSRAEQDVNLARSRLNLSTTRLKLAQLSFDHFEQLYETAKQKIHSVDMDLDDTKKRHIKKSGPVEVICGYDRRLAWSDESWSDFLETCKDVDEALQERDAHLCTSLRRQCGKHNGWQRLHVQLFEHETIFDRAKYEEAIKALREAGHRT